MKYSDIYEKTEITRRVHCCVIDKFISPWISLWLNYRNLFHLPKLTITISFEFLISSCERRDMEHFIPILSASYYITILSGNSKCFYFTVVKGRRTLDGGNNNNNTLIRVVYLHANTYISSLSPSSVLTIVHIESFARPWWAGTGNEEAMMGVPKSGQMISTCTAYKL